MFVIVLSPAEPDLFAEHDSLKFLDDHGRWMSKSTDARLFPTFKEAFEFLPYITIAHDDHIPLVIERDQLPPWI